MAPPTARCIKMYEWNRTDDSLPSGDRNSSDYSDVPPIACEYREVIIPSPPDKQVQFRSPELSDCELDAEA